MGQPSIFSGKDKRLRVQGILTKVGAASFERKRRLVKRLTKTAGNVSDADTIEALARDRGATLNYLRRHTNGR